MEFHPDNRAVYNEMKENMSSMVPFIGAGLTSFAYDTWPGVLKKLAQKLTNKKNREIIHSLIRNGELEKAAQRLEDFRGVTNLSRDIANYFSPDIFNKKSNILKDEALYLLPLLFPGLVLTTNFDKGLEFTYQMWNREFQEVLHPGHSETLRQLLRQTAETNLFKFHGTVSSRNIEYEKIVFTHKQYEQHYGEGSALVKDLKSCLDSKVLFFLGCSLKNDYTMKILQEIIQPGDYHYTIINCNNSERDEKILDLEKKHIRAILYKNNRHEAVKVILEQLLKETMPESYGKLILNAKRSQSSEFAGAFGDNWLFTPFYERKNEIKQLHSFLGDKEISFCWWAITGSGGIGKSRLAYEFQRQLPEGWDVYKLTHIDYMNLSKLSEQFTRKILIIADDVEEHAQKLGAWMEQLAQKENIFPIRVLLIGRKMDEICDSLGWNQSLSIALSTSQNNQHVQTTPLISIPESSQNESLKTLFAPVGQSSREFSWEQQFYMDIRNRAMIRKMCFQQNYLELKPLSDYAMLNIIKDYAYFLHKSNQARKAIPDTFTQRYILQTLKSIDPTLCRPLYARIVTDAYMSENEPEQWNKDNILAFMLEKELQHLEFRIRDVMGLKNLDRKLFAACQYIQCVSAVIQGIPAEKLQEHCSVVWEIILKRSEYFESPMNLLYNLGLMNKDVMPALKPYLFSVYFVYHWLNRQQKETIQSFLSTVWEIPRPTVLFFIGLLVEYKVLLNESAEKWDMLILDTLPKSQESIMLYSMFLLNTITHCNITVQCEKHFCQLENLINTNENNPEMLIAFAYSMVNLLAKQEVRGAQEIIQKLKKLVSIHPQIPELPIALAKGLVNFIHNEGVSNIREISDYLESMTDTYPDVPEIINCFADSLVRLGNKLSAPEALENIKRLESLAEKYSNSPQIIISLSMGLYNLTVMQGSQYMEYSLKRLEELTALHHDISDIAILFGKGLVNLAVTQQGQEELGTIKRLDVLTSSYPDVPEIAIKFAKILVNVSSNKDFREKLKISRRFEQLISNHPENFELVILFSHSLLNMCNGRNYIEGQKAIQKLKELVGRYPNIPELTVSLNSALYNMINCMNMPDKQKTLLQLEKAANSFSDIPEVIVTYAKALHKVGYELYHLGNFNNNIWKKFRELTNTYPNIPSLIAEYATFLFNISTTVNEQFKQEMVEELEVLLTLYPEISEIQTAYANSLVNLKDRYTSVKKLQQLAVAYPDLSIVITSYSTSLYNLCFTQNAEEAQDTLNDLEELVLSHWNLGEVLVNFAHSLMSLSQKQTRNAALKNIERLKKLFVLYPDTPEINNFLDNLLTQLEDIISTRP